MKVRHIERHETCKCECRFMVVLVITNNVGIKTNIGVN